MRFDPQAGFMPTEEDAAAAQEPRAKKPAGRAARWFLSSMVVCAISLGVWKFALPVVGPRVLHAFSSVQTASDDVEAPQEMSSRLAQALDMVARGHSGAGAGEMRGGPAFEAPISIDEEALLAMIDESVAADEQAAWLEEAEQAHVALEMAERLMAGGEYGDAQSLLRTVLKYSPNDAQVRYKLGLACVMQRDYAGARAELKQLRKLDPSLASLLSNLVPTS